MKRNLEQMSNTELKKHLSACRNDEDAFSEALGVLMSRKNPEAKRYPYPYDMPPEEVEAIFRARLNQNGGSEERI